MKSQKGFGVIVYLLAALAVTTFVGGFLYTYNEGVRAKAELKAAWKEIHDCRKDTLAQCIGSLNNQIAEIERLGKQAQAKADAERKRQDQVNKERSTGYEKRIAAVNDAYRRLRDNRSDPGGGPVPAIPDTARATDDTARDSQLLGVLQHADQQTARLIEIQQWVAEQGKVK